MGKRVEFRKQDIQEAARRAMFVCSNPACLTLTGFITERGRVRAIAQAAHIVPASDDGPRWDAIVTLPDGHRLKRGSQENIIWLCSSCHDRADQDPDGHSAAMLLAWKAEHEQRMSGLAGKDLEQSLLHLGAVRRGHDIARQLLLWLDGHRVMFDDVSIEFPAHVRSALDELRFHVRGALAGAPQDQVLRAALEETQGAAIGFFDALAGVANIDKIKVTSGDPEFEQFCHALLAMRRRICDAVRPLAEKYDQVYWWLE